jgi:Fe-S oxidoreductase
MWECTGYRRCAVFCPFDLDMGLLVSVGRFSLLQEGLGPEMIAEIGSAEVNKEIIDAVKEFYLDQVKTLETRLRNEFAPDLQIPVEKEGALRLIEYNSHDCENEGKGYTLIVISASCYAWADFGACRGQGSFGSCPSLTGSRPG